MQTSATTKTTRLLSRITTTAGMAVLFFIAAYTAGPQWYEDLKRGRPPASATQPPRTIARAQPLGPPISVTPMRPVGNDSSVSPIPLPLFLVRSQRGRNNREGFAQIGVRPDSPQTYTAGALLANGSRLTEIYETYVVLEHDGRTTRLYLQGHQESSGRPAEESMTVGGAPEPAVAASGSQDTMTLYLRPSPVFEGDRLHGYAVYPGRISSLFAELGLRPGDVLISLNGDPVSDSSDPVSTLQTLLKGAVVNADIERDGSTQAISLDGRIFLRVGADDRSETQSPHTPNLTL